jgi:5-methylcytosine-specific restriction endonuclease McrA
VVGGGRCPDHQRASAHERGYSSEWTVYARDWLVRFPWCGLRIDGQFHGQHSACARRGARVPARVVDHIVSLASGGAVFDEANHQSLCRSCNVVKG